MKLLYYFVILLIMGCIFINWEYVRVDLTQGDEKASTSPNSIVATDGSGNYKTISEALLAAPNHSETKWTIHVRAGTYVEYVVVYKYKKNIALVGEGRDVTIISGNKSTGGGFRLSEQATVAIFGDGFLAKDITFENTAGPEMDQAAALHTKAQHLTFFRCRFRGYQDTIYARKGYQFYKDCEIMGTIDFICGDAVAIFQTCTILVRKPLPHQSNIITAQQRRTTIKTSGTVLQNCNITATEDLRKDLPRTKTYLGRPWGPFSTTVIMNSFIDDFIDPSGWLEWHGVKPYYAEYNNTGLGANTSRRVVWAESINETQEAAHYNVRNFIGGDKWIPVDIPFFLD